MEQLAGGRAQALRPTGSVIRQIVLDEQNVPRRHLVIAAGTAQQHGGPVQVQLGGPTISPRQPMT
jgi:hypothetical protein